MPFVTWVLDQKDEKLHILLLQRKLEKDTILSDGENVARFRVPREPKFVLTTGRDFSIMEIGGQV